MPDGNICFFATSKSGLGHLRRSATIARCVQALAPARALHLISNAPPKGLADADLAAFSSIQVVERDLMAEASVRTGSSVMVLDTMTARGLESLDTPMALILRETPADQLHRFALAKARQWDLILVANPQDHWMPDTQILGAHDMVATGWIYRPTGRRQTAPQKTPTILVATGGGGTKATAHSLYSQIDGLLASLRASGLCFDVVQAIGPRAKGFGQLMQADRIVDPGGALNDMFRDTDIVISTAGYNSVLELATTDTPTLLVPIPRSIDDQTARARSWAHHLGMWLDADSPLTAANWLAHEITLRRRRLPVDLGPSGEERAARAILSLG